MKIIYSELKKWLPSLTVDPKKLRDDITMIGHFASGYEEVDGEVILDLEIRQNRADCLGYYGIIRDLSVFYDLEISYPQVTTPVYTSDILPITIDSPDVKRILSTRISNLKNSPSPTWLQKFLEHHDINSINTLVDLTNYCMIWWGIPCHAFDTAKVNTLRWENNHSHKKFTTLDGTELKLLPNNLIITNDKEVVSLSFIGGQNSGIELSTTETIIEMAVYNRSRVRSDSRSLKTITEASIRLDKELDCDTIPQAFEHLVSLIIEHCQGQVTSQLYEVRNQLADSSPISFDPTKPSLYSGVDISPQFGTNILRKLGCTELNGQFIPPTIRKDIHLEEDLIEEVIRFYGYNKIPLDSPIDSASLPDITPKILYLIESLKDQLVNLGYDEVRSWPLVNEPLDKNTAIYTQNSINSEYPVLRQSIIQSLKTQFDQYSRFKLSSAKFFEIGKVFSKSGNAYQEQYSLGLYNQDSIETDLKSLGLTPTKIDGSYAEVILDDLTKPPQYSPSNLQNKAIELTSQLVTLDANVEIPSPQEPSILIAKYSSLIDPSILWSMDIIDIYNTRYTFRVSYYNCDDKTAKSIHLKVFDLI
jgi:phenylalanyl-tRNA synthetase beta chain